jgi:uncharacterized protein (TIGR02271 family)
MQSTTYTSPLQIGTHAYSSDGEKIGDVVEVQSNYFVIEKGIIFTSDLYIPMSAVASRDDDGVRLSMTKDEIENGDWSEETVVNMGASGTVGYAGQHTGQTADMASAISRDMDTDRDTLERREERLTVDKQTDLAGSVRVGKHVVEEEQSVDVPVTREEVSVETRAVDRPASSDDFVESIEVPVYEERVEAGKEARVVEELDVDKTARTDTQTVTGTVRREEFDIDDDTSRP